MATITRGNSDLIVSEVKDVLDRYERQYPGAQADLYRQNTGSVRVRIVDPRFAGVTRGDRHDGVWAFLSDHLSEDSLQEVSILLLLAPAEEKSSFMNLEFNDPTPSRL